LAVLGEDHASRVEVSNIPVYNAVRRELLFDVAAATEPPVATAMVAVETETSMLEDTPKVNNQVNEGVIDAQDGGMEDVVNNGSQIDNSDGDQWATKDFVQKEIDLVVGLVEKQFEQMLEATMRPWQIWAEWVHGVIEKTESNMAKLTSRIDGIEKVLKGGVQQQVHSQSQGVDVVKVETDGILLQMSPQSMGTQDYFGANGVGQPIIGGLSTSPPTRTISAVGQSYHGHGGVGGPQMQALVSAPALLALQQNMKVPYFDGCEGKWIPFLKEWNKWSAYSLVGAPPQLEDVWKRDLFLTCLHKTLREHYENLISLNPSTTFNNIMEDIKKQFGMDNPHYFRNEWENVHLKVDDKLNLADFLLWKSRYLTARSFVQDFTDQEDLDLVLKNLPQVWREKVLQQEAKDAEKKWVVKVLGSNASEEFLKISFE
jgi:hypothetical protein